MKRKAGLKRERGKTVYEIDGNICKIHVYGVHHQYRGLVIIDTENSEKCRAVKWHISFRNNKPVCVKGHISEQRNVRMHHYLFGKPTSGMEYDHINRNPLDNRSGNIRLCDVVHNQWNRGLTSSNTSGYKGVVREKKKWAAQISIGNMCKRLGTFEKKEEAALAYNNAALILRDNFTYLNLIGGQDENYNRTD